jgi:hypothetical protein
VTVILNWSVLVQPVGTPGVMREPVARLIEMSELPHISVRVMEAEAGGVQRA